MKMQEVRITEEYKELDYVLFYLRRNYKTLTEDRCYYHPRTKVIHDMRPVYNAWKKDVVKLLREDEDIAAQKEIRRVRQAHNPNVFQTIQQDIIWDLLKEYPISKEKHIIA